MAKFCDSVVDDTCRFCIGLPVVTMESFCSNNMASSSTIPLVSSWNPLIYIQQKFFTARRKDWSTTQYILQFHRQLENTPNYSQSHQLYQIRLQVAIYQNKFPSTFLPTSEIVTFHPIHYLKFENLNWHFLCYIKNLSISLVRRESRINVEKRVWQQQKHCDMIRKLKQKFLNDKASKLINFSHYNTAYRN